MKSVSSFGWRGFLLGLASVAAVGVGMPAARGQPVVTNVTAAQTLGQREVIISYQLSHPLSAWCEVVVKASRDAGTTWEVLNAGLSGAVGQSVATTPTPATKTITWQLASTQWPAKLLPQVQVDVVVDDTNGMALIPAGTFWMGSGGDGLTDTTVHPVTLSAFYLGRTETAYAEWVAVRTWALDSARGSGVYDFGATLGSGKGDTHPVHSVTWHEVVKWCNAKSEREGLTPVYYTTDAQTAGAVYRTGEVSISAAQVKWGANGYRLPTEAEWEYAARGGLSGQRFPWGATITHLQANYSSSASYAYDVSTTRGSHPTYATGASPYTSPVGVFGANGYGLSDMVGNVSEWAWDWYGSYGSGAVTDPRGAASGQLRVFRGGSWNGEANYARSAYRSVNGQGSVARGSDLGFRPARRLEAPGVPTSVSAVGGNGQAVVSFSAPSNEGGSVITGYTVKATSLSGEVISATGASSPITVTGLMNGGLYTFTVAATNSGGTGAASAASVAVQVQTADPVMVLIPGGTFTMGSVVASIVGADQSGGLTDATPHAVTLSAFYLGKTETTYADWVGVRTWALDPARGAGVYDFGATVGAGKGDTHPVQTVSWYDVVKWCNAKSERAGLTPVYYTNDTQTAGSVYRTGEVSITAEQVKWGANGYRLPTEAEWEYAARGGVSGQRFPWGDTITHVQANYLSTTSYAYDVSTTRGNHPTYATGAQPYTSPVGGFATNGYGLSDMVGNVYEWTWDWYGSYGSGAVSDPRGAASGSFRVRRGGSWSGEAGSAPSANRGSGGPGNRFGSVGFRPARSSVP